MTDIAAMTDVERRSLLDDLQGLTDEQWATMTVCDPWTVRHLVAHLTGLGHQTPPKFFVGLIRNGFSFDRFMAKFLVQFNEGTNADVLGRFAATVENPRNPPGPKYVALGEFMCHGEDIRRALGRRGEHPEEHVVTLAEMYKKSGVPIRAKKRLDGLKLRATDVDWTSGDGPEVAGPGMDLVLAMTGRAGALDRCEGDGVAILRQRG